MKIIGFALSMIISVLALGFLLEVFEIEGDCTIALHICAYITIYSEICQLRKGD